MINNNNNNNHHQLDHSYHFTPARIQKTALFGIFSLFNFSSNSRASADPICPYVRTSLCGAKPITYVSPPGCAPSRLDSTKAACSAGLSSPVHTITWPARAARGATENARPENAGLENDGQSFYRAMLCIRGTSHGPVSVCVCLCLSVCLSQVGVLLKRLNVGSHKQHQTIAQGL